MRTLIVILTAVILGVLNNGFAQNAEDRPLRGELVEKRTITSKTFDTGDGSYTAVISTKPVHYLDEDDAWKEIDTRIQPLNGACPTGYDYKADANLVKIYFGEGKTRSGVAFQTDVEGFKFTPFEKALEREGSIVVSERVLSQRIRQVPKWTSVEGSEIRFHGQFGKDSDVAYEVGKGALIQRIYLAKLPDLVTKYDGENDFLIYRFDFGKSMRADDERNLPLYVDGRLMEEEFSTSKEMEFRSYYDHTIFGFSGSKVYETDGKKESTYCPYGVYFNRPHNTILSLKIPVTWLKQPDRMFPVVIENTLRVKRYSRTIDHTGRSAKTASVSDDLDLDDWLSVYQYDGGSYDDWTLDFLVGRDDTREYDRSEQKYRAWLEWDTSGILDGSDVTSATFTLTKTLHDGSSSFSIKADSMQYQPSACSNSQAWNDCGDGTCYQTFSVDCFTDELSFDNDSDFNTAIEDNLSNNWIAVGFKSESEGTNPAWMEFDDEVELTVVYTPIQVSNVQITNLVDNQVTISWTTSLSSYTFLSWGTSTIYGSWHLNQTMRTSHSYTITGLSASTKYYFAIGTGGYGCGDFSAYEDDFTTDVAGRYVPVEYSTIQSAINAASSGDDVYVSSGTYTESVSMKSGVDLIGSGNPTIQKSGGTAVTFNNANARLSGFTLRGLISINVQNSSNSAEIDNNTITGIGLSSTGINVNGCSPNIHDNTISDAGANGIEAVYSSDPTIRHNDIEDHGENGIYCYSSSEPNLGWGSGSQGLNNFTGNSEYNLVANANCDLIHAEYNWWGTSVESSIRANLYHGDGLDYIDYDPWRSSAAKMVPLAGDPRVEAARAENRLGRELLMEGKPEEAIVYFKGVIAEYGDTGVTLFALDHLVEAYEKVGNTTDLISYLEGVAQGPACSELRGLASEFIVRALVSEGAYPQAVAQAQKVVKVYPDRERNEWVWFQMGLIYELLGDTEKEAEAFRTFLSRYPVDLERRPNDLLPSLARIQLGLDPWGMEEKEAERGVSKTAHLFQSYPNPFNPQTALSFALPEAMRVRLVVYNILGQEVRVLVEGVQSQGSHTVLWDGRDAQGVAMGSGLYFARMEAGGAVYTRKLLLIR